MFVTRKSFTPTRVGLTVLHKERKMQLGEKDF